MTDGAFFGPPRPSRRPSAPADVYPTAIEIARRVAELKASGMNAASPDEYWTRAEDELLDRAARRVTG